MRDETLWLMLWLGCKLFSLQAFTALSKSSVKLSINPVTQLYLMTGTITDHSTDAIHATLLSANV